MKWVWGMTAARGIRVSSDTWSLSSICTAANIISYFCWLSFPNTLKKVSILLWMNSTASLDRVLYFCCPTCVNHYSTCKQSDSSDPMLPMCCIPLRVPPASSAQIQQQSSWSASLRIFASPSCLNWSWWKGMRKAACLKGWKKKNPPQYACFFY